MKQIKTNKIFKSVAAMAVLLTGMFFSGAIQTTAQVPEECLENNDDSVQNRDKTRTKENLDCWMKKVKNGDKNLVSAYLIGGDLTNADLSGADLTRADFGDSNLRGADFTGAIMTRMHFYNATVSRSTTKGINFEDWIDGGGIVVD